MRVIIAGSRGVVNLRFIEQATEHCGFDIEEVVCGGAKGADLLGKKWAEMNNIPVVMFPADWEKLGRSAGYIRNMAMAEYADALVAVWDGTSKGTRHMIEIMKKKDKPFYIW